MNYQFDTLNKLTQRSLGEPIVYKYKNDSTVSLKGIFSMQWVESNGVSTKRLTCEVLSLDLNSAPDKGDSVIRGDKTYKIEIAQENDEIFTLILKD